MKVIFDFDLDAWVQDIEVEGNSLSECKEKLLKMSVEDLIEQGYVKNSDITNIDYEVEEKKVKVIARDIEYEVDEYSDEDDDYYLNLPQEFELELVTTDANLEEDVEYEIYNITGENVLNVYSIEVVEDEEEK